MVEQCCGVDCLTALPLGHMQFGMKFLVAAKGRTGAELLSVLQHRLNNTKQQELTNARSVAPQGLTSTYQHSSKRVCHARTAPHKTTCRNHSPQSYLKIQTVPYPKAKTYSLSRHKHITKALWEITRQRLEANPPETVTQRVHDLRTRHGVRGVSVSLATPHSQQLQNICSGTSRISGDEVAPTTLFEIASLSKTVLGSCSYSLSWACV